MRELQVVDAAAADADDAHASLGVGARHQELEHVQDMCVWGGRDDGLARQAYSRTSFWKLR